MNERKRPFWNVAALIIQGIALLSGFIALIVFGEPESLAGLLYAVPIYAFFSLVGVMTACNALMRRERWWTLSWLALAINVGPFIYVASIILQKINL